MKNNIFLKIILIIFLIFLSNMAFAQDEEDTDLSKLFNVVVYGDTQNNFEVEQGNEEIEIEDEEIEALIIELRQIKFKYRNADVWNTEDVNRVVEIILTIVQKGLYDNQELLKILLHYMDENNRLIDEREEQEVTTNNIINNLENELQEKEIELNVLQEKVNSFQNEINLLTNQIENQSILYQDNINNLINRPFHNLILSYSLTNNSNIFHLSYITNMNFLVVGAGILYQRIGYENKTFNEFGLTAYIGIKF